MIKNKITLFALWSLVCDCYPPVFSCDVQRKRVTLLMAASLFQGASIGPLIDLAIQIDPRYVLCCVVINGLCEGSYEAFNMPFDPWLD